MSKYVDIAVTHTFIPLAFETLGAWGEQCDEFVQDLGCRLTSIAGERKETEYLKQRLSITVQRGNAIACLGTLPSQPLDPE